jgi:cyanophycinase
MPGPIGLLGGREHYEPMIPVDRRLLDETGVFAPEVVILPLASFKRQAKAAGALARAHWTRLGARARTIIPESGDDPVALEMIEEADVIVLPGGVPNRLVSALQGTPILEQIVARWIHGAAVSGSSAGAIALFEWRLNLYLPDPFRLIPSFGLLSGFVAAPHFDRLRVARWHSPFIARLDGLGVIGLDESTGLVGRDGTFQILGLGSVTVVMPDHIEVFPAGSRLEMELATRRSVSLRIDPTLDDLSHQRQGHRPADQEDVVIALDVERRPEPALGIGA